MRSEFVEARPVPLTPNYLKRSMLVWAYKDNGISLGMGEIYYCTSWGKWVWKSQDPANTEDYIPIIQRRSGAVVVRKMGF